MKVFSYRTADNWMMASSTPDVDDDESNDEALAEIERSFSDCFRCRNLVVLTGLGTSLHVNVQTTDGQRTALAGKQAAPTMASLWETVAKQAGDSFQTVLRSARYALETEGRNIESLLSHCKVAETFLTDVEGRQTVAQFIRMAEGCVRDAVRFVGPEDDLSLHADFLRRLVRRSTRKTRSKVFTVNFDLCFEYAARQGRYVVIDGFSHATPQVFDSLYFAYDIVQRAQESDSHDFIPNVFLLYKLHGSIDWTQNALTGEIEKDVDTQAPLLIYPRSTKYQLAFEQPYLEMMAALQAALRQQDTGLLVVGFGFGDAHIAEPILSAIRSNLSLKVVICNPSLAPHGDEVQRIGGLATENPFVRQIAQLIEQGDARLSLVNATFAEMVSHLPDIAAETDLEQHMVRLRQLRSPGHAG